MPRPSRWGRIVDSIASLPILIVAAQMMMSKDTVYVKAVWIGGIVGGLTALALRLRCWSWKQSAWLLVSTVALVPIALNVVRSPVLIWPYLAGLCVIPSLIVIIRGRFAITSQKEGELKNVDGETDAHDIVH